jgi:hypothetical protein
VEPPVETGEKPRLCFGQSDRLIFSKPAFSPDGQSLVVAVNCVSRAGATGNLYASVVSVSLEDGTPRQTELKANLEDGPGVSFSADGSRIAQPIRFGGSACTSEFSLFVADADGANSRPLLPAAFSRLDQQQRGSLLGGIIGFDWSPESDALVASVDASICLDVEPFVEPVVAGLYILKVDGSSEELLVEGPTRAPAWSPSGRYVAYVAGQNFGEVTGPPVLRVLDLTTGQPVDIGLGSQPAWQPQP